MHPEFIDYINIPYLVYRLKRVRDHLMVVDIFSLGGDNFVCHGILGQELFWFCKTEKQIKVELKRNLE